MNSRSLRASAAALAAAALLLAPFYAVAAPPEPSTQLVSVLHGLSVMNPSRIIAWSANPEPPRTSGDSVSALKAHIRALDPDDREAMFFWLRGHGRDALHQRGASDAQIGPPVYPIDYEIAWAVMPAGFSDPTPIPRATPPPPPKPPEKKKPLGAFSWLIPVALGAIANSANPHTTIASSHSSETHMEGNTMVTTSHSSSVSVGVDMRGVSNMLGSAIYQADQSGTAPHSPQQPQSEWTLLEFGRERADNQTSGIAVNHGLAGVRKDAEGAACVGFTNTNAKAVREVDFDLTYLDANNHALQTMALRRTGSVAPNAAADAPHGFTPADVAREHSNCATMGAPAGTTAASTAPFNRASAMAYEVRRVEFEDGTVWERPGANVWPAK